MSPIDPTLSIQSLETSNYHFQYIETGNPSGYTILFIHGYPGRPQDFRWMFPFLPHYRIISIAMPNLDMTTTKTNIPTTSIMDRVYAVLEFTTAKNISNCALVAHSMGGPIALALARHHPSLVSCVTLIASVGAFPYKIFRQSKPRLGYKLISHPYVGTLFKPFVPHFFSILGFPKGISVQAMTHVLHCATDFSFRENKDNIEHIQQPCLHVWTTDDPYIEEELFMDMEKRIQHCTSVSFTNGGHNPQRIYPTEIVSHMQQLLSTVLKTETV